MRARLSGPCAADHRKAAAPITVAMSAIVTQGERATAGTRPSRYANAITAAIGARRTPARIGEQGVHQRTTVGIHEGARDVACQPRRR